MVGRLADGRPFSGSGFVQGNGELMIASANLQGTLRAAANGNVTGTLSTFLPNQPRIVSTVAGSPFAPPPSGENAFGSAMTPIVSRVLFPADISSNGFINSAGGITVAAPSGITEQFTLNGSDGVLSGKIAVPSLGESRPVGGLYIPHKRAVVGLIGDTNPKQLTIKRR